MGLTPKTWMLLLSILLFVWGCDGAVTASSASISGSDVVLEIAATASSGSDTGTITQFVVGSDTYELSDTHTLGMQLNIKDFEFVYDMEFQEPIDDIREKADPWELSFTMDEQYQSISKKYAEKLLTELSSTLTADSHKNGCDFGTATYFYMNDLSGNWANPTSDQYQATYQWTRQTIEDTYSWWSREIKGIGCSGFSGRLQWGAQTFTNDERNRWGITYLATGNPKGYMTCPGSYYNRSLDAGLTGLAQCTATSNDNSCQCGNCVPDGTYTDGCFYSAYFTGYEAPDGANAYMHASTTGTRANYDANGDVVSWSSYNSSQVSSNPNDDPSNLVVTINGISSPNYLNINGSWEASTTANLRQDAIDEYSDSISNYFTSNRLVIPDISLYRIAQGGSLVTPPASTFTIIPENMFDEEHGCDSVNVDGWSWFVGSHNIMTTAQSTVGDTCTISGSNAHLVNWCTDSFGTCLSNVLSTWQSRGSLPNATFPGFDMLNIANDYSTKISVTDKDPSNNPILSWAEDDIELTLTYGFNNAITSPLSIPTSSLQFKEPQIGTVTPDYTTAQTSTTHFNLDFDVQNSGAVSGEFYYYTSCSKANTADFVSGTTTIAAGATETISTSIPGPDCAETEFNSESPYSITFSYTKQALWSAVVETTITSQPPPTPTPSFSPTTPPSFPPTELPSSSYPSSSPTSARPTEVPSTLPSVSSPTEFPTRIPTSLPSCAPTIEQPTQSPTKFPTSSPTTFRPTHLPTTIPSSIPSLTPTTDPPTRSPTKSPSPSPTTIQPTDFPTEIPTLIPSLSPSTLRPTEVASETLPIFPTAKPIEVYLHVEMNVEGVTESNEDQICESVASDLGGHIQNCEIVSIRRQLQDDNSILVVDLEFDDVETANQAAYDVALEDFLATLRNLPPGVSVKDIFAELADAIIARGGSREKLLQRIAAWRQKKMASMTTADSLATLPPNTHYQLEFRGEDTMCDLSVEVSPENKTVKECAIACDDYTGFSIGTSCETESCGCYCCDSGYRYETNLDFDTYALRHFQYCQHEADNFVPESSISTARSHRVDNTDMMALIVDYPGYMKLVNVSFANNGKQVPLNKILINEPDKCVLDNTALLAYSFGALVQIAGMEFAGDVYEFGLDLTFKYNSHFEPTDTFEEVLVERQAYFGFVAPSVFVLDIETTASMEEGEENFFAIDGWRFKADLEHGAVVEIDFQTFVTEDHLFTDAKEITCSSDYFNASAASVYPRPQNESNHLEQKWTLVIPAQKACQIGVHTESIGVELEDQQGYNMSVTFTIDLFDDFKPECSHELSNLAVQARVSTSEDGDTYESLSAHPLDIHMDTFLYVRVDFSLGLESYNLHANELDQLFEEINLSHIEVSQDGLIKCGEDEASDDCFTELFFRCETCSADSPHVSKHSDGAYYFRVQFPRDYGDGQGFVVDVNATANIDVELDFNFNYRQNATPARRVLTENSAATASGIASFSLNLEGPDPEEKVLYLPEDSFTLARHVAVFILLWASCFIYYNHKQFNCLKSGDYVHLEFDQEERWGDI